MSDDKKVSSDDKNVDVDCRHHWVISSPEGVFSLGKCRVCGLEREFRNSVEYSAWASRTRGANKGPKQKK